MNWVIQTRDLGKSYGGLAALQKLNLSVAQNSIFGFLGPNGAGKSTTIKLLLGLARPSSGSASIFGMDAARNSIDIRVRIGYLAQDPRFYDDMTARETLRFTLKFFFTGPKARLEERVQETLELVGLADKADRPIKGFSGGERQRLGIAQAQVNYPDLLILDEPAASLDPMGRRDVLEVMERLRKHTTIFYSTHILSDVQRVSDTVAILNHGKLIAQAPIDQLLPDEAAATYLLRIKGDAEAVRERLLLQPWINSVSLTHANGTAELEVGCLDADVTEARMLRAVLSDPSIVVLEFGRHKRNLEEIFVQLVEGGPTHVNGQ